MIVLVDLEWATIDDRLFFPTQLSALRVSETWNTIDQFHTLFRPHNQYIGDFTHIAFSGYDKWQFLSAPHVYNALESFKCWLKPDDVLCWWLNEPRKVLSKLFQVILKESLPQHNVILRPYFMAFVTDGRPKQGNPFTIAHKRGIHLNLPEHCANNDVHVLRKVMKKVAFDQTVLTLPLPEKTPNPIQEHIAYFDKSTGLVHLKDCPSVTDYTGMRGYSTLAKCISKEYKPCAVCCTTAWKEAVIERNADIVKRSECSYFYFSKSDTFHLGKCHLILQAKKAFYPVAKYDTCIAAGKIPCKLCKPVPGLCNRLTHQEQKAYDRYVQARTERDEMKLAPLVGTELTDMLTLTSTAYAFWSAPGYRSFHLRACPKLKEMHEVIGFSKFSDAVNAGYKPCSLCKPTKKQNVLVSIPIYNRTRENENISDILKLCESLGLSFSYNEPFLEITTPVGKWRINTSHVPVLVDHMPMHGDDPISPTYHRQHRIFLSLTDTLHYIKKHDNI